MKTFTHSFRYWLQLLMTVAVTVTFITSCKDRQTVTHDRFQHFVRVLDDCREAQPYAEFRRWLTTDPGSTEFLSELYANGILSSVAWSYDYTLAEVQWKDHQGACHSIVQVRTEKGFRTYPGTMLDYDRQVPCETEISTRSIVSFNNGWDTVYVSLSATGEFTPDYGNPVHEISAYIVTEDSLLRLDRIFYGQHADGSGTFLRFAYNPGDWSIRNSVHPVDACILDADHNMIYIPLVDAQEQATDRYHPYRFTDIINGFYQIPDTYSPEISPSLDGYDSLVQHYYADGHYFRVDSLPDGSYRYACWCCENLPDRFMKQYFMPDTIVGGGVYDKAERYFVFRCGEYTLQIPSVNGYVSDNPGYPTCPDILVTRNGKHIRSYHIGGLPY